MKGNVVNLSSDVSPRTWVQFPGPRDRGGAGAGLLKVVIWPLRACTSTGTPKWMSKCNKEFGGLLHALVFIYDMWCLLTMCMQLSEIWSQNKKCILFVKVFLYKSQKKYILIIILFQYKEFTINRQNVLFSLSCQMSTLKILRYK